MATKRSEITRGLLCWLPVFVFSLASLSACGGGDDGEDGADGVVTTTAATVQKDQIVANITGVSVSSPPVVDFTMQTSSDAAIANAGITGLSADDFGFYAARLEPGTDGNASQWVSYYGRFERDSGGTLVDHGDGSYTYTYGTDITADAGYDASLTHRITFEVRNVEAANGTALVDNPYYDFRPSDGATTGLFTRDMVDTEANCNVCHGELSFHGGDRRRQVETCVVCHNTSATNNDTSDFKRMIHKIHAGEVLPTSPIRDVHHPQDNRNCSTCHNAANTSITPDASNWYMVPTQETCSSCHDGARSVSDPMVDPMAADPIGHMSSFSNSQCLSCHESNVGATLTTNIQEAHNIATYDAAEEYAYNILDIDFSGALPAAPTVTFSVTDPTNGDAAYDLATETSLIGNLRFTVAWETDEYNNEGNGNDLGQPERTNVHDGSDVLQATAVGDGTYTLALSSVPASVDSSASATVTLEGHPVDSELGNLPVTSAASFFALDGASEPTARREVVELSKCDNCHKKLSLHGENRNENIDVCVACHNPNATDRGRRPADETTTADGRVEQAIDFKYMIHAIHAANTVVWGFGFPGTEHDFTDVAFPEPQLQNCTACHAADTYYPLDTDAVLGTTISSGADLVATSDNVRISPTTAVCSACHVPDAERDDPASTYAAKVHMQQNGGDYNLTAGETILETCSICHGAGRIADIETVHELN